MQGRLPVFQTLQTSAQLLVWEEPDLHFLLWQISDQRGLKDCFCISKYCGCKKSSTTVKNAPFNYAHTYTDEAVQQESEAFDLHSTSYVNRVTFWMEMKPSLNRTSGNIAKVEQ